MRRAWSSRRVLLPGYGADQREAVGPHPGFGFRFDHIGPIDSALPKKRILSAQDPVEAARKQVAAGARFKTPLTNKKTTRRTGRSGASVPRIRPLRLVAHLFFDHPPGTVLPPP